MSYTHRHKDTKTHRHTRLLWRILWAPERYLNLGLVWFLREENILDKPRELDGKLLEKTERQGPTSPTLLPYFDPFFLSPFCIQNKHLTFHFSLYSCHAHGHFTTYLIQLLIQCHKHFKSINSLRPGTKIFFLSNEFSTRTSH